MTRYTSKVRALAAFLDCDPAEISPVKWDTYGLDTFSAPGGEYAIGTDRQADKATRAYIEDSLWAFRTEFLADYVGADLDDRAVKGLEKIQGDLCEDANPLIRGMVGPRFGRLVRDAIAADGRGHFISGYDGEEHEVKQGKTWFYVYRVN
jgi:hypothetical protein